MTPPQPLNLPPMAQVEAFYGFIEALKPEIADKVYDTEGGKLADLVDELLYRMKDHLPAFIEVDGYEMPIEEVFIRVRSFCLGIAIASIPEAIESGG